MDGQFIEDKETGEGIIYFKSGDIYIGGVENQGFLKGRGVYFYKNGKIEAGTFVNNKGVGMFGSIEEGNILSTRKV